MEESSRTRVKNTISWPDVIQWAKRRSSKLWHHTLENIRTIASEYQISETLEDFISYASENPLLALLTVIVLISCGLPVLIFMLFVITSILIMITGFIFIEGTVLAVGSAFFCAIVFCTLTVIAATASVVAIAYFGLNEVCRYYQRNYGTEYSVANIMDSEVNMDDQNK